ncbi:MAG: hypothetical protein AAFY46_09740, partial [Planctomycetota bacterium]
DPWHAAAAMGVFGVTQGWGMAAKGPAIARFFGRPHHGAIRGFVTAAMVAGTAAGPFLLTQLGAWAGGELRRGLPAFALVALPVAVASAFAVRPLPPADENSRASSE